MATYRLTRDGAQALNNRSKANAEGMPPCADREYFLGRDVYGAGEEMSPGSLGVLFDGGAPEAVRLGVARELAP